MRRRFFLRFVSPHLLVLCAIFPACEVEEPTREDTPELITKMTLTFTPLGGEPVAVDATDPDGEGIMDLVVSGPVILSANTAYDLEISLINELAEPLDPAYHLTDEVRDEADEHIFYFGWTGNIFASPSGDGNIDQRADLIHYEDADANSLPLGLTTSWTTADVSSGDFRIILKHQPDIKSATSSVEDGETDLDIVFEVRVE